MPGNWFKHVETVIPDDDDDDDDGSRHNSNNEHDTVN